MSLRLSTGPHILAKDSTAGIMRDVLIALLPTAAAGVYLFGLSSMWVLAVSVLSAVAAEAAWQYLCRKPIEIKDCSAAVTGLLLGLCLPSSVPLWIPLIGGVFAIVLVKQLFGGIGHNFLNPALAARAVLLASWPARMTNFFLPRNLLALFGASTAEVGDAVTSATPLMTQNASAMDLLLGNVPGTIGEVCKIAILIGLAYLLIRGVIGFHIPVLYVGTFALLIWLFGGDPLTEVLAGGLLFGAVFMATDYVTNPMTTAGQCIFAVGCGLIVALIRQFGSYPEGVTFSILLMNILTPLIDRSLKRKVYGEVKQHA